MSTYIQEAKEIQKNVSQIVSSVLFKEQASKISEGNALPPKLMIYIAECLEAGNVSFDIDLGDKFGINETEIHEVEMAILKASTSFFEATGILTILDVEDMDTVMAFDLENGLTPPEELMIMASDEIWLDQSNKHSRSLSDLGLSLVLVVQPGSNRLAMRVNALDVFKNEGWVFVESGSVEEDKIREKWHQDTKFLEDAQEISLPSSSL